MGQSTMAQMALAEIVTDMTGTTQRQDRSVVAVAEVNSELASDALSSNPQTHRPVRSFVLRGGRLTGAQDRALTDLWPKYGVDANGGLLDLHGLFGNRNPVILEIGFGNGEATWQMASASPSENFIGVEVYRPGAGRLLLKLAEEGIENVRVACADAVVLLKDCIADGALQGVRLYFPDPWPKARHLKRRIVQPGFIELLAQKIAPAGVLHLATDWRPYAEHMLAVMNNSAEFVNPAGAEGYSARPSWRPRTKYETRGQRLGHPVFDLLFLRVT